VLNDGTTGASVAKAGQSNFRWIDNSKESLSSKLHHLSHKDLLQHKPDSLNIIDNNNEPKQDFYENIADIKAGKEIFNNLFVIKKAKVIGTERRTL